MSQSRLTTLCLCWLAASLALAGDAFYRDAQGQWHALQAIRAAGVTRLSLAPEAIGGGGTLLVLDKPDWMVLEDTEAPVVIKLLVEGKERGLGDLDMGWTGRSPGEITLAVKDDTNPLDLDGLRATLNGAPVAPERLAVQPLGGTGKQARIALSLTDLPPGRYAIELRLTDLAPALNALRVPISFNSAPLLANSGFEEADANGKPVGWSAGAWSSDADTEYDISVKPGGAVGEKALCFTGLAGSLNMVCAQRTEDLRPGVTYAFTGQYRSAGGCALSAIANREGKEVDYLSQGLPASADWAPFTWEFTLQEHDFALIAVRAGSLGESWFDDLQVVPK
jgi:hypothetical protein